LTQKTVDIFDSTTDGIIILTPANLRAASDEALEEFIQWAHRVNEETLKRKAVGYIVLLRSSVWCWTAFSTNASEARGILFNFGGVGGDMTRWNVGPEMFTSLKAANAAMEKSKKYHAMLGHDGINEWKVTRLHRVTA
jgi:hypothetical protein